MRACALVIMLLLFAACASKPPRCDEQLVPINVFLKLGAQPRTTGQ